MKPIDMLGNEIRAGGSLIDLRTKTPMKVKSVEQQTIQLGGKEVTVPCILVEYGMVLANGPQLSEFLVIPTPGEQEHVDDIVNRAAPARSSVPVMPRRPQ